MSYFERAIAIEKKAGPGGASEATSQQGLGDAAALRGDFAAARDSYEKALAIRTKVSPDGAYCAETLHSLGALEHRFEQLNEAAKYFRRAIEALEAQTRKLGGTDAVRDAYSANHQDYYRDYLEVLIELTQRDEAFGVIERSRARALLAMLVQRDLSSQPTFRPISRRRGGS